jgi:hypothetical protein
MRSHSFLPADVNRGFAGGFRGLADGRFGLRFGPQTAIRSRFYSAADIEGFTATSDGFRFAADIMKSQMRGTISDLKREPLKTP